MKVGQFGPVEGTETSVYNMESKGPGTVGRCVETVQVAGAGAGAGDIEQGHWQYRHCCLSAR